MTAVKTPAELGVLLEGLLTPRETREIIFRWRLITRLLEGVPQRDIAAELGVSLGKISRGSRLLQYGPPEFRALIEKIHRQNAPAPNADARLGPTR